MSGPAAFDKQLMLRQASIILEGLFFFIEGDFP